MPKFKFSFERDYTIRESCERVIEADTLAQAQTVAKQLAGEFNTDCPDDVAAGDGGEATDFETYFQPVSVSGATEAEGRLRRRGQRNMRWRKFYFRTSYGPKPVGPMRNLFLNIKKWIMG